MRIFRVFFLLLAVQFSLAQAPKKSTSSEIYHDLQKLNFLGSALYIAAHPDDENTRLISYFSNHIKARTAYLSLTRGDGGQNLIGPELRELLGVLRTQELLAARRVDGGEQFFTRANDFGFSKHPRETLKIWDKDEVLSDVVWVIRNFKPDVIINRFDHRSPGTTHGHHTASAMLSVEAFDLAGNNDIYTSQLNHVDAWQPKRLFFNTSWWFYGSRENFEKADKSRMIELDIGVYYPTLGLSNNEIASLASSQHLCQGFGRLSIRGSQEEYIELIKGELPGEKNDIFDGIDTSWSRIEGGEAIGEILYPMETAFNFTNPETHLPDLLKAHQILSDLKDQHWKQVKLKELEDLIADICGLYLEASAEDDSANPGSLVKIKIEALNRSQTSMNIEEILLDGKSTSDKNLALVYNKRENLDLDLSLSAEAAYSNPYWLQKEGSLGMYRVADPLLIGKPETPVSHKVTFCLNIDGYSLDLDRPVVYRYSEPDKGELYKPFNILPKATASFDNQVYVFAEGNPQNIPITVTAHADNVNGEISLKYGDDWNVAHETQSFEIGKKGDQQKLLFTVTPPRQEDTSKLTANIKVEDEVHNRQQITIAYDHIPTQSVLLTSTARVVRLNIQKSGEHIGYIMGAGDQVPESLEQIGYQVHTIDPNSIQTGSLDKYDAVVVGIRAYNVVDELKFKQKFLFEYVENGGNLIIQYNTAGRWTAPYKDIAPFPLQLSRDRVTDENSMVEIIAPRHPLVSFPNTITPADFDGWVQERGLYFPNEWDAAFTPILSMQDEGEAATEGALLVAPYGKGHYIYTGLSFFRELPAGVPGAFKLFANMLSIGKDQVIEENAIKG